MKVARDIMKVINGMDFMAATAGELVVWTVIRGLSYCIDFDKLMSESLSFRSLEGN